MEFEVITIGGSYFLDDVFNFAAVFTNAAAFKNFLSIALAGSVIYFSFPLYTPHAIFCLILGQWRNAFSGSVRSSLLILSRPMRKMDLAYRP